MDYENYQQLLTAREASMAFNDGLKTAVHILEKADKLSPQGRRLLIEELKEEIVQSETDYTLKLLMCYLVKPRDAII